MTNNPSPGYFGILPDHLKMAENMLLLSFNERQGTVDIQNRNCP
jgi:hypothetical protein